MKIYVSWSVDQLDGLTAAALMADNVGELRAISQSVSRGAENVKAWAMASGGSPILDLGIVGAVEVPADRMTELPGIAEKFQAICEGTLSIGIGMTLSESYTAMRYSQMKGGDQISLYHVEMEQELDSHHQEGPDELASLGKADSAAAGLVDDNQHGAGGKFSAKPSEGHPAIPGPNMEVAQAPSPIGEQASTGGLDANHSDPNSDGGNVANDDGQGPGGEGEQDPRTVVIQALQAIKQNAPILEQMKQTNPQAFQAVKAVVDAMILMAQGMATEQTEDGGDESAEVQKSEHLTKGVIEDFDRDSVRGAHGEVHHIDGWYALTVGDKLIAREGDYAGIMDLANGWGIQVQKSMPDDPKWDRSWNVTHTASHGTYHMSGGMSSHSNGSSKQAGVNLHYVSKKGKRTDLGNHADKHLAHAAREEHHDRISAGFKKEELVASEPNLGVEARRQLEIDDYQKDELAPKPAAAAPAPVAPKPPAPMAAPSKAAAAPMMGAPKMHNTVEGFMGGLKMHPKGSPERGKFITSHMNHAPFLAALGSHPAGPQVKQMLNVHLNSTANAGFKPGATVATVKSEVPGENKNFAVGTEKDGKVKVQHTDPQTGANGETAWRSVRSGEIMSEDGHPVSSRNPSST